MQYKKIYIVAPTSYASGGPETIHQFCEIVNNNYPGKGYVVYVDENNHIDYHPVLPPYQKYNVQVAETVEDSEDNILITTETFTYFHRNYKNINKMVMWLSLAFHFPIRIRFENLLTYSILAKVFFPLLYILYFIKNPRFITWKRRLSTKEMRKMKNSYNALLEKRYFENHHINSSNFLCGPIAEEYFVGASIDVKKENIITYNPKKGFKYFSSVMDAFKNKYGDEFRFVPIENMSSKEVVEILDRSVLYVDFGYFPGHERIPRQAVLRYANTIVSTNGTAKYEDIAVPNKYKFACKRKNINTIVETMYELAKNHQKHIHEFDKYRELTYWQKDNFEKEVVAICEDEPFDLEKEFLKKETI